MAQFTNTATLSYNGNVTTSNTVTGTLQEILTATKTAVMDDYTAGDDITYVISLANSGTSALTGITVTDNLGEYTFASGNLYPLTYTDGSVRMYTNGVLGSAPTVAGGPPLVFSNISIPAQGNVMLIYEASANQYAPLAAESSITNTVTVTGGGLSEPVTASETVTTQDTPELTINKALCPTTVADNGQLTYTFSIQNTGNTAAESSANIIISDTFLPILNPISVTFNGAAWSTPTNYTYNASTGAFATVAGQVTVPAATYTQDPVGGSWTVVPGVSTLVVTGTV